MGHELHEGTRAPFALSLCSAGTPIEASSGRRVDAQDAAARDRERARARRSTRPGLLDESRGRHARRTSWLWSAGAGVTTDGRPVYWNLVAGMFEGECVVWVDGEPHHVGRLPFDGLDGVGDLRFTPLAVRTHHENYLVLASDYEQPFGTFSGSLPIAGEIVGHGVMERHDALW